MTSTPVPDAAVQIVWKTLADFLGPDRYRAEEVVAALAAAGWLDDPERRAARQVDHDAVVAERDALAEEAARMRGAYDAEVRAHGETLRDLPGRDAP